MLAAPAFQLLLLSQPEVSVTELALLPDLFAAGLTRFHVRKPGWPATQMAAYVAAVAVQYRSRLVLHGHAPLVRRYQLGGLHLTASQRTALRQRPALGPAQSLSTSFHSLDEISQARRRYDYVFLSPIFDSISKAGYVGGFELPALQTRLHDMVTRAAYCPPILALGGITVENMSLLAPLGFAGAAVLGSVWQSADPVGAFQQLKKGAQGC
jgi:thiamine-phosphate pyrophosphorylase